jgi:flavin-dependent dehydrogenase
LKKNHPSCIFIAQEEVKFMVARRKSAQKKIFKRMLTASETRHKRDLTLEDGSRVAVVGCGPAGSFFSFFLLDMAKRIGLDLKVDIFEPRSFFNPGPKGCNMCGGIISESLVQMLAAEGITLPPGVIQRGIDSYLLHTDSGSVRIETPMNEKRIGAVHRGAGPKDSEGTKWGSFDGYLQVLALEKGANLFQSKVEKVSLVDGYPTLTSSDNHNSTYDLMAVTAGVNTRTLEIFQNLNIGYDPPQTTRTLIREYFLGKSDVEKYIGSAMHVFLIDIPRIEFAALIPKEDYVTLCMLGDDLDESAMQVFVESPEVKRCFPPEFNMHTSCKCLPRMVIKGSSKPFADRLVFVGDCGVSRLFKDGIGAAYRCAKAAATTCIFEGVSQEDFKNRYWPFCRSLHRDNKFGKVVFAITHQVSKRLFTKRAVTYMVLSEKQKEGRHRIMSTVLWDMFAGSASYKNIFLLMLNPLFLVIFFRHILTALLYSGRGKK